MSWLPVRDTLDAQLDAPEVVADAIRSGMFARQMIGNPPSLAAFFETWRRNGGQYLRYEGAFTGTGRLTYEAAALRPWLSPHVCGKPESQRVSAFFSGAKIDRNGWSRCGVRT